MTWQQTLFSGKGRLRRRDYWLWSVGLSLVSGIGIGIFGGVSGAFSELQAGSVSPLAGLFYFALGVTLTWIGVCLISKRWHDRDKSGWMYLILLIPVIGWLWTFIECGFLDGTQGPNRYGPSPKGIGDQTGVF